MNVVFLTFINQYNILLYKVNERKEWVQVNKC